MAQNITETSTFEATVPSLITTDAVKGSVQGSDPNVGEANGPHINVANRTRWLNDNKLNKSGGTMTGDLILENANVKVKVGANVFFEAENNGRMKQQFADDPVHRFTTGKKSLVIADADSEGLGSTGLTAGELFMIHAVLRVQGDGSTAYIAFGMIDTGNRQSLKFEAQSSTTPQHANDGYSTTAGFQIQIIGGAISIINDTGASKTVDVIVEAIGLP